MVDEDTHKEYDQMRFIFIIVPLMVHRLLPLMSQCLDQIGENVINSRYDLV